MKKFNFSLLLGCSLVGIAVVISGIIISSSLPDTTRILRDSAANPSDTPISQATEASVTDVASTADGEIAYQTYQIPTFGIEFDCPVGFTSDVESNVISESEVFFSVKSAEDKFIFITCSRITSLNDMMPLYKESGVNSSILFEQFKSLDVTTAIASLKDTGFEKFELLNSFSATNNYGFYYIGKDKAYNEETYPTQLCYKYKSYGDFADRDGVIRVDLFIGVPETDNLEDFTAFCKAVTYSIRLSSGEASSEDGAPLVSEYENWIPTLRTLKNSTPEEQCAEIVAMFFEYVTNTRYSGVNFDLILLMNNNEDLLEQLRNTEELLDSAYNFTSEFTIHNCEESTAANNEYSINIIETRIYDDEAMGQRECAHTLLVVINSPTDYYVSGIGSELFDTYEPISREIKNQLFGWNIPQITEDKISLIELVMTSGSTPQELARRLYLLDNLLATFTVDPGTLIEYQFLLIDYWYGPSAKVKNELNRLAYQLQLSDEFELPSYLN